MLDRYLGRLEQNLGRKLVVAKTLREAHEFALNEAQAMGHHFVGVDHLSMGLAQLDPPHPILGDLIDLKNARLKLEEFLGRGERVRVGSRRVLFYTPRAKDVLFLGANAATKLGDLEIGPEHLWLGVLEDAKRGSSILPYSVDRLSEIQMSIQRYRLRI